MSLTVRQNNAAAVALALARLASKQVLVGVPATDASRREGDPMNNAQLAYLHDKGSPANNIPARPFMRPGIEAGKAAIVAQLSAAAQAAVQGKPDAVDARLNAAGLAAQSAIRKMINSGIAPALAAATIAARKRRGRTGTKPLIDTAQLRNSITYVIRSR